LSSPDYTQYSLEQLYDVLDHINRITYPDRVEVIKNEIEKRQNSNEVGELETPKPKGQSKEEQIEFHSFILRTIQISIVLKLITLFFGIALLIGLIWGFSIQYVGYQITFSFPGIEQIDQENILFIAKILVYIISSTFFVGGLSTFFKKEFFDFFIIISWGILTLGFQIGDFVWWPTFLSNFSFQFTFEIIFKFGIKLNFASLFFLMWAIIINPKAREEFFHTKSS